MGNGLYDDRVFPEFSRDIKQLKRYRHCIKDVEAFARLLDAKPDKHCGERYSGFGIQTVYKARAFSRDIKGGKSSGFRIILLDDHGMFRFVKIYTHNTEPDRDKLKNDIIARLKANGFPLKAPK